MMSIAELTEKLCTAIHAMEEKNKIAALNQVRRALHEISPFKNEPVDCVEWVKADTVQANDYNPNKVAPPEMKLLERSITEDGYTMPIVTHHTGFSRETVDGYHRGVVGKTSKAVQKRTKGYLPVSTINADHGDISNRMASTIRHNRARGSHEVELMVNIVGELVESGMSDMWIMKHIGMDADELLRLKQISGIAALFKDKEFSMSWE